MKRILSVILALALVCTLGAAAYASGESVSLTEPAPVFEAPVVVLEKGQAEATFIVKGYQVWDEDGAYQGIGCYDAADEVVIYGSYEDWQDDVPADVSAELTAVEGSTDLQLTIDTADLAGNTVYYVSIAGDDASPVYIVTAENAAAVDNDNAITFELGSTEADDGYTDSFTLPLSHYAFVNGEDNVRLGGSFGLFTADSFEDVDEADADAVNWYLGTGGTNGGDTAYIFGSDDDYARLDLYHYLYRFFCIEGSGGFGMYSDIGNARWFSGASGANTGYVMVDIIGHTDEFNSYKTVTVGELVTAMYNAIVSPFSSRSEAGEALAAALMAANDGEGAEGKIAAMETMGRYDAEAYPDVDAEVTKLDACYLMMTGLGDYAGKSINTIRTELDADFLAGVEAADEAGQLDEYNDGEIDVLGIAEDATASAETSINLRGNALVNGAFFDNDGIANASAMIVQDGAVVTLVNTRIASSGSNPSDTLADRDYRLGIGAGLLAIDEGTVVKIFNTTGELNTTGASNGSMAGCMFTGFGSIIYAEHGQFFSAGQHPSNTCYDGTIIYNESTLTGGGRTFSTDFFGGKVIFCNSVSNQLSGNGFVIDESSSYFVVNSYIYGGSSFETNGEGQAYYQNSYVKTKGSWVMQNNTSLRSDCDYVCGVNTVFDCSAVTFLTVQKEEHAVVRFVNSTILTGEGDGYLIKISGDEWQTNSWLQVNLENTDLPEGKVFVAGARDWPNQDVHTDGTTLEIITDGNSAVNLTQVVTDTESITTYEDGTSEVEGRMGTNYATDLQNNGTITVNGIATGLDVVDGEVVVTNEDYAEVTVTDEAATAVYTIDGAVITLIYNFASASGEASVG